MNIGVISDTHDFFHPRVRRLFTGVDHILHGGDIGKPGILRELEKLAPVTAVCGNTDEPGFRYPKTAVVGLGSRKFLLHHIVNPYQLPQPVEQRIRDDQVNVVVFGHTHKPFAEWIGSTLFFNPGYAGNRRFGMERSVAILSLAGSELDWRYLTL